jgi:hypothetical protein
VRWRGASVQVRGARSAARWPATPCAPSFSRRRHCRAGSRLCCVTLLTPVRAASARSARSCPSTSRGVPGQTWGPGLVGLRLLAAGVPPHYLPAAVALEDVTIIYWLPALGQQLLQSRGVISELPASDTGTTHHTLMPRPELGAWPILSSQEEAPCMPLPG